MHLFAHMFTSLSALHGRPRRLCCGVRPQTVAYSVDVFALAGAQNTAVSVQIPTYDMTTYADFYISFPYAVRPSCPRAQALPLGDMQQKLCMYWECICWPCMIPSKLGDMGFDEVLHN